MPGWDVRILDDDGEALPAGETGRVVVKLPLPPGCLPTLWNDEEGFRETRSEIRRAGDGSAGWTS